MKHTQLKKTPKISVIMPFRNAVSTLDQAVKSILLQSFSDFEFILVDDFSDDGSNSLLADFSDDRLVVIANDRNLGLAKSLNKAVSMCRGKYIARMDADDICFSNRLEKQYDFLEKNLDVDLVGSSILLFIGDGEPLRQLIPPLDDHDIKKSFFYASAPIYHPTWMARAEWFHKNPYDGFFLKAQDYELLIRASSVSKYRNLSDVLLGYRCNSKSFRKSVMTRLFVFFANSKVYLIKFSFFSLLISNGSNLLKLLVDFFKSPPNKNSELPHDLLVKWKKNYLRVSR